MATQPLNAAKPLNSRSDISSLSEFMPDEGGMMPNAPSGFLARHISRLGRVSSSGRLRRSTLVALRWGAISGQSAALLLVWGVLGFAFPYLACLAVIGLAAFVNIIIHLRLPLDRRVSDGEALLQLGFDVFQLAALLYLTGGMENPFVLLFIAPVVTGATTLRKTVLTILIGLSAPLSFLLLYYCQPLPWYEEEIFTLPFIFKLGMWIALMTGMAFTSLYAWRASLESRRMSNALAATEAVLAHEQKLAALGGLAAAAAHELGTPLATIQVTANEMARELASDTPMGEDARLVLSQAKRCRDILQMLARRGDEGDAIHDVFSLKGLLDEVAEPFYAFDTQIVITIESGERPLTLTRQAELLYGLTNIVENACDFAGSTVSIMGRWDSHHVQIDVLDDGPGFDPAIRSRLGEPYVSSRQEPSQGPGAGGLGLGFFISKTLLERTGGTVTFGNRKSERGAFVRVRWPRMRIESEF